MKKILGALKPSLLIFAFFCLAGSAPAYAEVKAAPAKTGNLVKNAQKAAPDTKSGLVNAPAKTENLVKNAQKAAPDTKSKLVNTPAASKENLRIVVSAGALMGQNPFGAFFQSRLFRSEENPPLIITNANAVAFETDSAVFYSQEALNPQDIVQWTGDKKISVDKGFIGQSYRGVLLEGPAHEGIRQYLGADSTAVRVEKYVRGEKVLLAFSKSVGSEALVLPKAASELRRIPAIIVSDVKGTAKYLVAARWVGDLSHRLGLVDRLIGTKKATPWVDLGTNHGQMQALDSGQLAAVEKRHPMAVFLGTWEMASHIGAPTFLGSLPTIYPFGEKFRHHSTVDGAEINFWSVSGSENLWPLFGKLGKRVGAVDALNLMNEESSTGARKLNIVRAFSEEAAAILAKSVFVDLVLLLAKDPYAQLPSKEIIELKEAKSDAFEQVAPIVKLSYLSVSEIKIFGPSLNNIQRVEVVHHVVNDDMERAMDVPLAAPAVTDAKGLPASFASSLPRLWTRSDLEKILGGVMLEQSKADLAIFGELHPTTSINGEVPFEVARSILSNEGNVAVFSTTGRQIKKIGKLMSGNRLNKRLVVYGMDSRTGTIGKRVISDNEQFKIALSEEALLEIFGLSRLGGLGEDYAIRAPFVEAIYADVRQLFFISGPKVVGISDTYDEIEMAVAHVKNGARFDEMLAKGLANLDGAQASDMIAMWQGKPHHVLTFDIAYLDVGVSKNATNSNYVSMSKNFPTSRGTIQPFVHLFLFTKISLNHDAPSLQTSLFNETKYMHTKLDEKPEKDKTKLGIKFRIPWERSLFAGSSVVLAPIFRTVYETKLAPIIWPDKLFEPKKEKLIPTKRIDSLLGMNVDFTKLGFNTNIGAAMAVDFTRTNVHDAIDFGPGVDFYSKWSLIGPLELSSEINAFYLFPLPRNTAINKAALYIEGTAWLRLARFYDFSVAAVSDCLVATFQESPKRVALSSIFGLTVSYGRLFRLLG